MWWEVHVPWSGWGVGLILPLPFLPNLPKGSKFKWFFCLDGVLYGGLS